MQWNACVHRQDLGLYSQPIEFWRNGARNHVNSKGKSPVPEAQRRFEPAMLYHTGQQVQHTTSRAIPAPVPILTSWIQHNQQGLEGGDCCQGRCCTARSRRHCAVKVDAVLRGHGGIVLSR